MPTFVRVLRAGRMSYASGLRLQGSLAEEHRKKKPGDVCNSLVLIEHDPTYTIGIRRKDYSAEDERKLLESGAEFHRTNRGGLITFHGPGQLVAYPILDLRDFRPSVRWYVCQLERMIIRLCAEFGLRGETSPNTGVWVGDRKICAIGIHGSRYVTTHGLAINCNTDLSWFENIVPCGIVGKGVTSLSRELGVDVTVDDVAPLLQNAFRDQFDCELVQSSNREVQRLLEQSAVAT